MRILAEVVLFCIILGGAIVFYKAIWKMLDRNNSKNRKKKGGE